MSLENTILANLLNNEEYSRKTFPFLKQEYFSDSASSTVFRLLADHVNKFNNFPSKEVLFIELDKLENVKEEQVSEAKELVLSLQRDEETKNDWLISATEGFCQDRAILLALQASINIYKDKSGKLSKGIIPQILTDALAVSFDASIGHDFLEDADLRYELYHRVEQKIPFDLDYFNRITKGGLSRKTLTIIMASTGVGKSLFMCHMAASNLAEGQNVLYITLEMGEAGDPSISERIDANLLNVAVDDLLVMPKANYMRKIDALKNKITKGKLIIKEYPTATAGSATFRALLNELKIKKKFIPDIIYVDYLNICVSSRFKGESGVNSYSYIKSIAEELRGLAVEFNVPIVSATQTNRAGYNNTDIELENTSESIGLPMTTDFMIALMQTDELHKLNQIMVKQLKNRYTDPNQNRKFVIGVDKPKMRLYDVEQIAQDEIIKRDDDKPVMDTTMFGEQEIERAKPKPKFDKSKFQGFK